MRGVCVALVILAVMLAGSSALAGDQVPCRGCYKPRPATSYQMQIGNEDVDPRVRARLYLLDWIDTPPSLVRDLHRRGRKVFCYISAGTLEDWRPDKGRFPQEVIGNVDAGYEDEHWLDIRRLDVLEPIMIDRMDVCKRKGFDGVWLDNVDGFEADTGLDMTGDQQLAYNAALANDAHSRELGAGFNNDPSQLRSMARYFDWVLLELDRDDVRPCFYRRSCRQLQAFRRAHKATFVIEYDLKRRKSFCDVARRRGFNGILKHNPPAGPFRIACPAPRG